jgi:hypothetical protein
MRDENSAVWYWESTGQDISEFHWKTSEPTLNSTESMVEKACINFNYVSTGWSDDYCAMFVMDAMCES